MQGEIFSLLEKNKDTLRLQNEMNQSNERTEYCTVIIMLHVAGSMFLSNRRK